MKYFPARRRIAARGTDLRVRPGDRCGLRTSRTFLPPGHAERIFLYLVRQNILRVTYSEPDMCSYIGVVTAAPLNRPKLNKP